MLASDKGAYGVLGDVWASRRKLVATICSARRSACSDSRRVPLKRQITITEADASIAESRPKPSSATEPASIAAVTAIAPSAVM